VTDEVPIWVQAGTYPARLDRGLVAQMRDEGVDEGFKVVERGAGANMSVDVPAGTAIITGDDQAEQGNYRVRRTSTVNLTGFVAASTTQRIDGVDLRINDPNAGGPAGSNFTVVRTAGTESGSPVAPAVPSSAIRLATVGPFTTSTSSITNSMITDVRVWAGLRDSPGTFAEAAGASEPSGWLLCDGRAVSRTTYARLFDRITTVYGVGDGSTTFNIPDRRGRSGVGLSNLGTAAGNAAGNARVQATAGSSGGEVTHSATLAEVGTHQHDMQSHVHGAGTLATASTGDHVHTIEVRNAAAGGDFAAYSPDAAAGSPSSANMESTGAHTHTLSGNTAVGNTNVTSFSGSSTGFNVTHPYAGVYVLIRT
jgi:microcystin-dependent protein